MLQGVEFETDVFLQYKKEYSFIFFLIVKSLEYISNLAHVTLCLVQLVANFFFDFFSKKRKSYKKKQK